MQGQLNMLQVINKKLRNKSETDKMSDHRLQTLKLRAQKYQKLEAA